MVLSRLTRLSRLAIYTGLLACIPVVHAATQEYRVEYRHSSLDKGLPDWNDQNIYWQLTEQDHDWLYIDYKNWNHFGLEDNNLALGRRFYIRDGLQYQAELSASKNNNLFPAYSLYGGMETKLNRQTILTAGLRHSHYRKLDPLTSSISEPDSEALNSRVEYYFGDSMVSYSLFYTLMHDASLSDKVVSQSLKYLYSYQVRSNVFISIDHGGDIDFVPNTIAHQLSISQIDSLTAGGRHWLSDKLAMIYTVSNSQVRVATSGFNYQRNVVYLGFNIHSR